MDTKVKPAGKRSATLTPVAASGPVLLSVTVNVTLSPTLGLALLTVLVKDKSANGLIVVASLALSLVVLVCPPPDTVAVLVIVAGAVGATFTVSVIGG